MTPEELQTARDFEEGWSEERIHKSEKTWGPGIADILPPDLAQKLRKRALIDGTSDLDIIQEALRNYLRDDVA